MTLNGTPRDFDFIHGTWHVEHRRLTKRLASSSDWEEFDGTCTAWPLLGGSGNIDDNVINLPSGIYRASSLRAFDHASRTWAIWWLDSRRPHQLDVPVIGGFKDGIGEFLANDELEGLPIQVRFRWNDINTDNPRWEQAFSPDNAVTWETNWTMAFARA
jgi:hypothetical protein